MARLNSYIACILLLSAGASCYAADDLASAQEMFDQYRYGQGLAPLERAARSGDRQARLSLGMMLIHGESLYGQEVQSRYQAGVEWLRLAAGDGCEVSSHLLQKLENRSVAGSPR